MKYVLSFLLVVSFTFVLPNTVQANEGVVPYSVEAVIPDNQINENVSYFDIELNQGQKQDLEVVIYNSSDEEITVDVENNFAATNSNGLIIYDASEEESHESMKHPFSEMSSIEKEKVLVAPNDQETISVKVEAPDESFDGVILGGLYFYMDPEEDEEEQSVQIQNRYSYALGVQIREAGNETEIEPKLEFIDATPGTINHRTGLQTQFVNTAPMIIGGLTFEGSVYQEGEDEPIHTRVAEDFTIAPNSKFNFPVMYDNQKLEPGTYTFKGTASNDSHEWEFEEQFEVSADEADEANDDAVELEEDYSWLIYLVIGFAAVIIILFVALIILVVKRKK